MRSIIALCLLPFALCACPLLVIGAVGETGITIAESRDVGTKLDDQVMYTNINNQFIEDKNNGLTISATVNVRHGRVMLTGNVASQQLAQKAVAAAWKVKGVKEVYNDLIINPDSTYGAATNDLIVKKNLVSRFIITKNVWYINYSSDVVAGNAYLLGDVKDQAELDRVLQIARTTKGIKRVVSHLRINAHAHDDVDNSTSRAAPVAPVMDTTGSTVSAPDSIQTKDITSPDYPPEAKPTWH